MPTHSFRAPRADQQRGRQCHGRLGLPHRKTRNGRFRREGLSQKKASRDGGHKMKLRRIQCKTTCQWRPRLFCLRCRPSVVLFYRPAALYFVSTSDITVKNEETAPLPPLVTACRRGCIPVDLPPGLHQGHNDSISQNLGRFGTNVSLVPTSRRAIPLGAMGRCRSPDANKHRDSLALLRGQETARKGSPASRAPVHADALRMKRHNPSSFRHGVTASRVCCLRRSDLPSLSFWHGTIVIPEHPWPESRSIAGMRALTGRAERGRAIICGEAVSEFCRRDRWPVFCSLNQASTGIRRQVQTLEPPALDGTGTGPRRHEPL